MFKYKEKEVGVWEGAPRHAEEMVFCCLVSKNHVRLRVICDGNKTKHKHKKG